MDVWTQLTALEPSVDPSRWASALETPGASDPHDETPPQYHDHPRELTPFIVPPPAPVKRIKTGGDDADTELVLFERVAALLALATSHGVTLSATRVLAFLR